MALLFGIMSVDTRQSSCCRPGIREWHKVPGTSFLVDCFGRGAEKAACKSWFLTHFHADHWRGLTKSFKAGAHAEHARELRPCLPA